MLVLAVVVCSFCLLRILHRLYYLMRGHIHHLPSFSPRKGLETFLQRNEVTISSHQIKVDDCLTLRYRKLGKGSKVYLLANGVGTDFFMWFPVIKQMMQERETLFDEITLIVPNYRGLFEPNDNNFQKGEVSITVKECVQDIITIMKDAKVACIEGLVGWSTGAQVGLELAALYPDKVKKLFLLNPSCGKTLHTALQPFAPLPSYLGKVVSERMTSFIQHLKTLITQPLWVNLKGFNDSTLFYLALSIFAFIGGFPPEQPSYFHEYMKDAFKTRSQTRALLDLILSLDEPMTPQCFELNQHVTILSGTPDFLTGVYHSKRLQQLLKNSKHVNFTMGSHFLLIEWPDHVAKELLLFMLS